MKKTQVRKNSFTMLELLCLIAVLSLLALLLPAAATAGRDTAGDTACLDNQRKLGEMFAQFANDNNGVILPARVTPQDNAEHVNRGLKAATTVTWVYMLRQYLGLPADLRAAKQIRLPDNLAKGILRCPLCPTPSSFTDRTSYGIPAYWIGGEFGAGYGIKQQEMCTSFSQLANPAAKAYLCDSSARATAAKDPADGVKYDTLADCFWVLNWGTRLSRDRHQNAVNILFADFHAAPVTTAELQSAGAVNGKSSISTTCRNELLGWKGMKLNE